MADKLIPLFHQTESATVSMALAADTDVAATHNHVVESRIVKMDADGNDTAAESAPVHTLILDGDVGVVFKIDFLDTDSLNANGDNNAASKVVVKRKGNDTDELTFDAIGEEAIVMFTENFFLNVGGVFGAVTTDGVFT